MAAQEEYASGERYPLFAWNVIKTLYVVRQNTAFYSNNTYSTAPILREANITEKLPKEYKSIYAIKPANACMQSTNYLYSKINYAIESVLPDGCEFLPKLRMKPPVKQVGS